MSSDQVAKLAATIDVLSGAVQFLIAERVGMQPDAIQDDLLRVLQRSLSTPTRGVESQVGKSAIQPADLAWWVPIVATNLIDDVRRQLGRKPEGVTHIAPAPSRAIFPSRAVSETFSEMAERARREDTRRTGIATEDGRSAA